LFRLEIVTHFLPAKSVLGAVNTRKVHVLFPRFGLSVDLPRAVRVRAGGVSVSVRVRVRVRIAVWVRFRVTVTVRVRVRVRVRVLS
jgi:hypothetical protein